MYNRLSIVLSTVLPAPYQPTSGISLTLIVSILTIALLSFYFNILIYFQCKDSPPQSKEHLFCLLLFQSAGAHPKLPILNSSFFT